MPEEKKQAEFKMPEVFEQVSKISLGEIGCAGEAAGALPNDGDRLPMARIYGKATGIKMKEDKRTNTIHTMLTGQFRAVVLQPVVANSGKGFQSGVCYLPAGLHEQVVSIFEEDPNAVVTFGYDVFAYKRSRGQGAKYSYGAQPLAPPRADDPMAELAASFQPPKLIAAA